MDKIWLRSYKPGINAEIKLDNTTLVDLFQTACNNYANKRAVTCHRVSLTFGQVYQQVMCLAQALAELGITKGDRVAIILPNSLQYPISVFAILALGAAVVNVNPLYTPAEIEYVFGNAEPKAVICLDMFADKLNGLQSKYGIQHVIMTKIADPYPLVKRTLIGLALRYLARVKPQLNYTPLAWRDLVAHPRQLQQLNLASSSDLAFIQYTGATTGKPKGAMLLHRNIVANIRQVYAVIEAQVPHLEQQIVISALPLYHIFALTANLFTFFFHGAENVMVPNAKNIKDLVKVMNSTPFTVFNSLDTLYNKLLEYPAFVNAKHPHYKYGICGGMPTRHSVAKAWQHQVGLTPCNCYGLTETSPCVTMSYFDEEFNGGVGYPVPSTEIEVRDLETHQHVLGVGEVGAIMVRGPQVMAGYWRNPHETAQVLSEDGWLKTGDIGYFTPQGQLVISSRETEMIIVSGFNVYPAEVERVIDELAAVREVAVVGYPDADTGEAVAAFIVCQPQQSLSNEQILAHCRQQLARYKIPRQVQIVAELPKTLVGKIDKKALVAAYLTVMAQSEIKGVS